jgi:translation initiation factor 1
MKALLKNLAYSTDKNLMKEAEEVQQPTLTPENQLLKVQKSTKHRGGKTVSVILGFEGSLENMEALCKKIKAHCGTGGAAKDDEIIIQGDHLQKIVKWLHSNGYTKAKVI